MGFIFVSPTPSLSLGNQCVHAYSYPCLGSHCSRAEGSCFCAWGRKRGLRFVFLAVW